VTLDLADATIPCASVRQPFGADAYDSGTRIVKNVVVAHGGWRRVENEEGKGTMFLSSLPVESP